MRQGVVPDQWIYPRVNVENDLRLIAVTNCLAKIAEKFVNRHFNEYFDEYIDAN